jgi:hypothetical protein
MAKRVIYRNTFIVTILSEEMLSGDENLATMHEQMINGDWSGVIKDIKRNEPLKGAQAVNAILAQGSDPEFFRMDRQGNELKD